ncbi:MAG TPA: hypothetical protein VFV63_13860 [Ilumatobacteraceae bacterium]|nr:hypothetical protein [Ilumatobacteraceae bacterium]
MRLLLATAILTLAAALTAPAVTRAQDSSVPDGSVPTSAVPAETTGSVPGGTVPDGSTPGTVPLVPVPSACTAPPQPEIVFVGTLVERDFRTGRFEIEQVRAGSEDPFAIGGLIDVRYGLDVEYLDVGTEYLVSARRDPVIGLLASKIREPAPLFGGDDVVGVAESDVECPRFEDPIRTFLPDGSSVDSAVLAPLGEHTTQLIGAVLIPIGVAFAIVFVLATLRWGVGGLLRGVGSVVRHSR